MYSYNYSSFPLGASPSSTVNAAYQEISMTDIDYSLDKFKYLKRRSILPLLTSPNAKSAGVNANLPDMSNVQGDVVYLFPKVTSSF